MTRKELERKIHRLEVELAACEAEEARLIEKRREMSMRRATADAKMRNRLELNAVIEKENDLRLKLWGLRQLNLPG